MNFNEYKSDNEDQNELDQNSSVVSADQNPEQETLQDTLDTSSAKATQDSTQDYSQQQQTDENKNASQNSVETTLQQQKQSNPENVKPEERMVPLQSQQTTVQVAEKAKNKQDDDDFGGEEQEKQENRMILATQVNKSIQLLSSDETEYNAYKNLLSDILKFSPKPTPVEQSQNEEKFKYNENIKKIKEDCTYLLNFPLRFNNLQNKSQLLYHDYQRLQSQVSQRIMQHLNVTYILTAEDLGSLFKQINANADNLNKIQEDWEQIGKDITSLNISSIISNITVHYSTIFGMKENKESLSQLEQCKASINTINMECQNQIDEMNRYYEEKLSSVQSNENLITLSKTKIANYEKVKADSQKKKDMILKEIENGFKASCENKESQLKEIRKQLELITKRNKELLENKTIDSSKRFKKLTDKINQLNNKYPIGSIEGSGNSSQKNCFHYFVLIDESGSFTGAHQNGIEGTIRIANNLQQDDFFTCIKFDSSATVNYPKTKKSNIDFSDLRRKIENCASGGTSFLSAFTKLREQIQLNLSPGEYPVVVFITDGSDSSDLTSIITSILMICGDIIFYTIGYGSINEKQLKSITNKFNKSSNEKKEINGKDVALFYHNQTPQALQSDLEKISTSGISIEDIIKAKEFFKKSYDEENLQVNAYYKEQEDQILNEQRSLLKQEQELLNPDIQLSFENMHKGNLKFCDDQISLMITSIETENQNISKYEITINKEKQSMLMKFQLSNSNLQFESSMLKNLDANKLLFEKTNEIKNGYKDQITELKNKITQLQRENEASLQTKKTEISEVGFQNESHFVKFNDLYPKLAKIQEFYSNILYKYIALCKQLVAIDEMLEQQIDFSNKNLEKANQGDNQQRIFKYFQKLDPSINVMDSVDAKNKILLICNSSILESCKENKLEKFYDLVVKEVDFNSLFDQVDKKKEEQEKYIREKVIPDIIRPSKSLNRLKTQFAGLAEKIKKAEKKLKDLQEDLKEEKDSEARDSIKEEIDEQKEKISELKAEQEEKSKDMEEQQFEFNDENSDRIKVVSSITMALLKAILVASLKRKYDVSIMPFQQYVEISQNTNLSLKSYAPLQIKSS